MKRSPHTPTSMSSTRVAPSSSAAASSHSSSSSQPLVSSAVTLGPSRSNDVKALNHAYIGTNPESEMTNRYKYRGFNARIQTITINFRSLLESHEQSSADQAALEKIANAQMFMRGGEGGASSTDAGLPISEAFSSSELSTQDPRSRYSYFLSSLESFSQTNLYTDFLVFHAEVRGLVQSFPLLVQNKERIIEILLKHAVKPGSDAQYELFTLISVLSRDLRSDFYPFFGRVMKTLLSLLNPSDAKNIHAIFQTLASLFKYTSRQLSTHVPEVYEQYFIELLCHHKSYIRHFASQALAYLLRIAQRNGVDIAPIFKTLLHYKSELNLESYRDGVASTLFESLKNIQFQFQVHHAKHIGILLTYLRETREEQGEFVTDIMMKLHRRMANYTRKEYASEVWSVLIERLEKLQEMIFKNAATSNSTTSDSSASLQQQHHSRILESSRILQLITLWMTHRGGSRIPNVQTMNKVLALAFGKMFGVSAAATSTATTPSSSSSLTYTPSLLWHRTSSSLLIQVWRNLPAMKHLRDTSYEKCIAGYLDRVLGMKVEWIGASGKEKRLTDDSISHLTLFLSFLESSRDLLLDSPGALEKIVRALYPVVDMLLTTTTQSKGQHDDVAQTLGLSLLLELNGVQPVGSAYQIQSLEELHERGSKQSNKNKRVEQQQDDGDDEDDTTGQDDIAVQDEPDEPAAESDASSDDIIEEEVDASSYTTPLPQPTLYACSARMFGLLKVSKAVQSYLLKQLVKVVEEKDYLMLQKDTTTDEDDDSTASTLILAANKRTQRFATIWSVLQLLPASGIDVAAPVSTYVKSSSSSSQSVAEFLMKLIDLLSTTTQNSTTFISATPLDAANDASSSSSTTETNNHLLVAHAENDQCIFLRSQVVQTCAQMMALRFGKEKEEVVGESYGSSSSNTTTFPFLSTLQTLLTTTLSHYRSSPTHIATVTALEKCFEVAKGFQVGGVRDDVVVDGDEEEDAPMNGGQSKSASKKKKNKNSVATASTSSSSTSSLTTYLRTLFSSASFTSLIPTFLPNLSSAHGFLRTQTVSLMRYFVQMRFMAQVGEGEKKQQEEENDEDMDVDDQATAQQQKVGNRSELVGECPLLTLMYDISLLTPTLEYEKEYVRLLKKIEVLINSNRVPDAYMRCVASFLLGLLHIKFNPLWIHIQKILCSSFVTVFAVTPEKQRWLWTEVVKVKLEEIRERTKLVIKDEEKEDDTTEEDNKMDVDEKNVKLFEKHHARHTATSVSSSSSSSPSTSTACLPSQSPLLLRFSHFVSLTSRSTDSFTYATLLYTSFSLDPSSSSSSSDKTHNSTSTQTNGFSRRLFDKTFIQQEMIDLFLGDIWNGEYMICYPNVLRIEEGMVVDEESEEERNETAADVTSSSSNEDDTSPSSNFLDRATSSTLSIPSGYTLRTGSRKLVKTKLLLFLKFFLACFHRASKLPRQNELKNMLLTLLANQEEEVQKLSLQCLAKYQLPYLNPYLSTLQNLISETKWRDTMTSFNLAPEAGNVQAQHRLQFSTILIRIIYPRITQRQMGKSSRAAGLGQRRAAVLGFLGGLSHDELQHLVAMVMGGQFRKVINKVVVEVEKEKGVKALTASTSTTSKKSEEITFDEILTRQIPELTISQNSRALQKALLNPKLYATASSSASSSPSSSKSLLLIPTSKQVGFLHMLQFFLTKLKTLSIPYVKLFIVQCIYMLVNAEVQIEKRKKQLAKMQASGEAAAAAVAESKSSEEKEDVEMTEQKDDEGEDEEKDSDAEEDENEEDEDAEEDETEEKKSSSTDEKKPSEDDDIPIADEEAELDSRTKKSKSASSSKFPTPYLLQKYLTELREIRQLIFLRMSTILEQYPQMFSPPTDFVELKRPKGTRLSEEEESRLHSYTGPSLYPYLQCFLTASYPSLTRLATEGTQYYGGLWQCLVQMTQHHYLLVNYLMTPAQGKEKMEVLCIEEEKNAKQKRKDGLMIKNLNESSTSATSYPLFSLLLDSLSSRSVHTSIIGAILSISESLLRAREDAQDWIEAKQELEEAEKEREEKLKVQKERKEQRKKLRMKMKKAQGGGSRMDDSDDDVDDDDDDDDARLISSRLIQIETLYLSPASHTTRVRQHYYSHFTTQLTQVWSMNVDKYLTGMHLWIGHLAQQHKAANGRIANSMTSITSVTKKKNDSQSNKQQRRTTFFPRRELEVLSQIACFATSSQTAKKLVDLLLPFLMTPEKGHLQLGANAGDKRGDKRSQKKITSQQSGKESIFDRLKSSQPTLHHTLLRILYSLTPLMKVTDLDAVFDTLQKLLFSLKSSSHRTLVSELYLLLSTQPEVKKDVRYTHLPLLANTIVGLNAMSERRIDEYDDARRLQVYGALDTAFAVMITQKEIDLQKVLMKNSMEIDEEEKEKGRKKVKELEALVKEKIQQAVSVASTSSSTDTITYHSFTPLFTDYFSSSSTPTLHARSLTFLRSLTQQLCHDLLEDDLGIRSSAGNMLKRVIHLCSLPYENAEDESTLAEIDTAPFLSQPGHLQTPSTLLTGLLYPHLKQALKNPVDKVRREVIGLLRTLILAFPRYYRHYLILCDTDPEKDFLENITSIQLHSRRKALTRLYQKITIQDTEDGNIFHAHHTKSVDITVIQHILFPLLHHFIYDPAVSGHSNTSGASDSSLSVNASGHSQTQSFSKQQQQSRMEGTLLEEALKLAGKLSAYMSWSTWYHSLQGYLKLITVKPALERTLVKLICAFIREWHFTVEETPEEKQQQYEEALRRERDEEMRKRRELKEKKERERQARGGDASSSSTSYDEEDMLEDSDLKDALTTVSSSVPLPDKTSPSELSQKIRATLTKRLLPQLHSLLTGQKMKKAKKPSTSSSGKASTKGMLTTYENQNELTSKSGMAGDDGTRGSESGGNNVMELVRVPVAMALIALLRQLPRSIFHLEFPRLLTKLCLQLQHREQQARDLTRSTLLEILQLCGPYYFHFFLDEFQRHLVNGYQLHVRGYMIYTCLDVLVNKMKIKPGEIDHSLILLMEITMNDLLGEPAKQKEIAAIRAQTKEARINHANDTFQLLAQVISFPSSIHYLIDPFRMKLQYDSSLRIKDLTVISETLKRVSIGLHLNQSVQSHLPELLIYIHSYLFRNISESFSSLFPSSSSMESGKLSKQDKKATAQNKNRYRKLDMTADSTVMETLRQENRSRSEGKIIQGGGLAQRKAMEFLNAISSSSMNTTEFEKKQVKAKPSKDETYLLVQPTPPRQSFGGPGGGSGGNNTGHHANLILVFGLQLLYFVLKHKKLDTGVNPPLAGLTGGMNGSVDPSAQAASLSSLTPQVVDNLSRLDPFLQLIRDYCLVMGSDLQKDSVQGTKSVITKEGDKKTVIKPIVTSSSAVIHIALKCSEYLLQITNLPSLSLYLKDLSTYMFSLIYSKPNPAILSQCYHNLSVILKYAPTQDWKSCGISVEKQRILLVFIKSEVLATYHTQATSLAFKLLQAILSRSIELEELYDFIITISKLMVTSENDDIRKQCSSAVYMFLYNYKLGTQRLQTHFGFLLNQLQYPYAAGRMTILKLFGSIFQYFHVSVLEEQFSFLFLPLVVHMVNETDSKNKEQTNLVLSVLLGKVSAKKQQEVMRMVYGWWKGEEQGGENGDSKKAGGKKRKSIAPPVADDTTAASSSTTTVTPARSAQAQLLEFASLNIICIMIDLLKSQYNTSLYLHRSFAGLVQIMKEKLKEQEVRDGKLMMMHDSEMTTEQEITSDGQEDTAQSEWRVLYTTLLAIEKLFKHLPSNLLTAHIHSTHSEFFSLLIQCLTYPHTWIRTAACRVVGFILSAIPLSDFINVKNPRQVLSSTLLSTPRHFFSLLQAFTRQLQSQNLTEALAEQIVKNIVWCAVAANNIGGGEVWEELEEGKEKEEEEEGEEADVDADEEAEEEMQQDDGEEVDDDEEHKQANGAADDEDAEMEDAADQQEEEEEKAVVLAATNGKKNKKDKHEKQHSQPTLSSVTLFTSSSSSTQPPIQFPKSNNRILHWLFTRLSYMCRHDTGILLRESIFRFFATMASQLPKEVFSCFLLQVIHPLYRLSTGQVRQEETELQSFATQVLELIQAQIGTQYFLQAYSTIRSRIQSVRQARQVKKKQLAMIHPQAAVAKKQAKHQGKRVAKKRKLKELKEGRANGKRNAGASAGSGMSMDISSASSGINAAPSQATNGASSHKKKKQKL